MFKRILFILTISCSANIFGSDLIGGTKELKRYIVEMSSVLTQSDISLLKTKYHAAKIAQFYDYDSDYFKRLYKIEISEDNIKDISNDSLVRKVEEIHVVEEQSIIVPTDAQDLTHDPFFIYQWANHYQKQDLIIDEDDITGKRIEGNKDSSFNLQDIKLANAAKEIIVAVLDSGIDIEHEDLKDSIYKNTVDCDERGNIPFRSTEDNDQNGHKGDCMGWNFTSEGEGDNRPYDDYGHGTHVSGIIAAQVGNGIGIAGVSKNAKILPVKILKKQENLGSARGASSFTDRVAKGILYAIKSKAQIINLSLGWPAALDTTYMRNTISEAISKGILVVAAAGNNSTNRAIFPCSYKGVLCVGATTINKEMAGFSNYGGHVDILAPGEKILSTYPNKFEPQLFSTRGYEIKNGTSQAAPYISAIAAIIYGQNDGITIDEVKARLHASSGVNPTTKTLSGMPDLKKALSIDFNEKQIWRPQFKDLQTISVDEDLSFSFRLGLEHFGKVEGNDEFIIEAKFENEGISVNKIDILKDQEGIPSEVIVQGQFSDLQVEAEVNLNLSINVSENVENFKSLMVFARVTEGNDFISVHLPGIIGPMADQIRSIFSPYRSLNNPEYYLDQTLGPTGGRRLKILKLSNLSNTPVLDSKEMTFPTATKVLSVFKIDLNYDGKEDYLVRFIGEDPTKAGEDKRYIGYKYLNQDLMPLLQGVDEFKYFPEQVIWDPNNSFFMPIRTTSGKIAVPVFKATGGIPKLDRQNDPFNPNADLGEDNHLYYFVPDIQKKIFNLRIVDNAQFREKLKEDFSLNWYDSINIYTLLAQGLNQLKEGKGEVLILADNNFQKKLLKLRLSLNLNTHLERLNANDIELQGNFKMPLIDLTGTTPDYQGGNVFIGLFNDYTAQISTISNGNTEVEGLGHFVYSRKRDALLGVLASFKDERETIHTFFQSKGNLIGRSYGAGGEQILTRPIHRVSFVPGSVFNEMFFPVVANRNGRFSPGFYIDSTQLFDRHLYVVKLKENTLAIELGNSLLIPSKCRSLNPSRVDGKESFTLLCSEGPKTFLKFLSFM